MLGIIIINYNSYSNTIKCIKSIIENHPINNKRIYVVDNGSTNNSFEYLENEYSNNNYVILIQSKKNNGYSCGLNLGIKKSMKDGCDYFLLCNNDLLFPKHSIDRLLNLNIVSPEIGVAGGLIEGIDGNIQKSYKIRMTYKNHLLEKKPFCYFNKNNCNTKLDLSESRIFDGMVSGACFLLSKSTINKIGLLDENIFLFYEEDALSYKFHAQNLKAIIDPSIRIIHFGSTTIGTNGIVYYYNRYKSSLYVLNKYMNIRGIKLFAVFAIDCCSLLIKSLHDKEYLQATKKLFTYYKKLKRCEHV